MFCAKCGKWLDNGMAFCPHCGEKVQVADNSTDGSVPQPNVNATEKTGEAVGIDNPRESIINETNYANPTNDRASNNAEESGGSTDSQGDKTSKKPRKGRLKVNWSKQPLWRKVVLVVSIIGIVLGLGSAALDLVQAVTGVGLPESLDTRVESIREQIAMTLASQFMGESFGVYANLDSVDLADNLGWISETVQDDGTRSIESDVVALMYPNIVPRLSNAEIEGKTKDGKYLVTGDFSLDYGYGNVSSMGKLGIVIWMGVASDVTDENVDQLENIINYAGLKYSAAEIRIEQGLYACGSTIAIPEGGVKKLSDDSLKSLGWWDWDKNKALKFN